MIDPRRFGLDPNGPTLMHYALLGRFIHQYARVEVAIHRLFRHVARLDDITGRAIGAGMRIVDLIDRIKRLIATGAVDKNEGAEIGKVFTQLNAISELRDALVHRGAVAKEDELISHNAAIAKSAQDIQVLRIKVENLRDATEDLHAILFRIMMIVTPDDRTLRHTTVQTFAFATWRYTRLVQETPYRQPQAKPQSQRRRRGASRASLQPQ
jgi:hypothetical protein